MFFPRAFGKPAYIIAGLGNPGKQYENTRHNSGFVALDFLAQKCSVKVTRARFSALTAAAVLGTQQVLFLKPQTFMNNSGEAVAAAANFYKIPPERVLVIFDDVSLSCGDIRVRKEGSSGGHNGIKSIIEHLGSQNFPRVKIGVGGNGRDSLVEHVLSRPSSADQKLIISRLADIADACELIVNGEIEKAQGQYNSHLEKKD